MVLTLIYVFTYVRLRHLVLLFHFADAGDVPGIHDGSIPNGLCQDYRGLLDCLCYLIDAAMIIFEKFILYGLCLGYRSCSAEKLLILMGGGMPIVPLHISFTTGRGDRLYRGDEGLLVHFGTHL
jgi:hypothetical protein